MSSSNLSIDPLCHPSTTSSLQTLIRILETSIGPTGKLKLLENSHTLTSSSQRLLNHISIKNIFTKIIVSTAKTQLGTYNDGGLFCSLLILKLVCPLVLDNSRSLPLVGTLYEHFAAEFLSFLKEESSLVVDFSDLRHLKSVVLTILSSKPGCLLSRLDRDHLCSLLLRAFLDGIPSNGGSSHILDCFRFLTVDGLPTTESKLFKGVLIQIPETDEKRFIVELARLSRGPIRVVLFTCSLAGDADWPVGGIETTSLDLVTGSIMHLLDNVVSQMVLDEIKFVFCQKVVHPSMKKRLQKAGIMILDRLGSDTAKYIQYISGGTSIASLSCEMSYGTISSIKIKNLGRKSYLLTSNDTPVFSFVLAHHNEEASAELKIVCRQAMDSLLRILKNPRVCFGGGCSEVRTGILLANKVRNNLDVIKKEIGCTTGQVMESLTTFLRAVTNSCAAIHQGKVLDFATESTKGHLWKLHNGQFPTAGHKCQCGSQEAVLIEPSSWSFLSDIHHLYEVIPLTRMSSDKPSMKVSSAMTITNESLKFLNSSCKDVQPVSSNLKSAFQLPNDTISPDKSLMEVSPAMRIANESFNVLNSSCKEVQPVSSNLMSAFQLPDTISPDKSLLEVSPAMRITNESFEVLNSPMKDVQAAVSCNLISASLLPNETISPNKLYMKVSPAMTITNESFNVLNSSFKDIQPVSTKIQVTTIPWDPVTHNLTSASQLPNYTISPDKSSMEVSPASIITNESFEFLNSTSIKDDQHEAAVSSNPISVSQLPTNSNSSSKYKPPRNPIPVVSAIVTSSTCVSLSNTVSTNVNSLTHANASNAMPAYQLSTNISSSATYAPLSNSLSAGQLSTSVSSATHVPLLSSAIPPCQLFPYTDTLPSSISSIGPSLPSSHRSPQSTSDATNSIHLDELSCKLNVLSLAFETASLLLRTTVCINNLPA